MRLYLPLIALLLAMPQADAAAQTSDVRVFFGYENQRADLFPSTLSAFDGLAISVERLVPPSVGSLLLDVPRRLAFDDVRWRVRSVANAPVRAADRSRVERPIPLALWSSRESRFVSGAECSRMRLGGIGYEGTSSSGSLFPGGNNGGWSPAVEVGVGADAGIRRHVDARVRASWLSTDFNNDQWHAWRHHTGLSTGLVLKP